MKLEQYRTILMFFLMAFALMFCAIAIGPIIFDSLGYSFDGPKTITYSQAIDYTMQALLWSLGILFASVVSKS